VDAAWAAHAGAADGRAGGVRLVGIYSGALSVSC
jgi:hypothetical protein